jgi:hypothetical protein
MKLCASSDAASFLFMDSMPVLFALFVISGRGRVCAFGVILSQAVSLLRSGQVRRHLLSQLAGKSEFLLLPLRQQQVALSLLLVGCWTCN